MKTLSAILLILCAGLLVAGAISNHARLPETVVSHFSGSGEANGWVSRSSFTASMLAVGVGLPALMIGIMYSLRFLPARYLNVPNATYWRKTENYKRACEFLLVSSFWFGSAFLLWQAFFSRTIVEANLTTPPHLDTTKALLLTIPLLVFSMAWVTVLIVRFQKQN